MKKSLLVLSLAFGLSACNIDDRLQFASETKKSEQVHLSAENTGLLIIDAQQGYVMDSDDFWVKVFYPQYEIPAQNVDPQLHSSIDRIAQLAQKANELNMPTTITYEAFETDLGLDYTPYITRIEQALDENTQSYFKQTFNSTLEADIHAAMKAWSDAGVSRVIVAGAETDVCVMQTVLGLKKMGFDVYLASDATFSTEIYERPTFKRLQQAGVKLAKASEIIESMAAKDKLIFSPRYAVGTRDELYQGDRHKMAMINFNMDDTSLAKAEHDNKPATAPRFTFLGLEQEFLFSYMPSFHVNKKGKAYTSKYRKNTNVVSYKTIDPVIADIKAAGKTQAVISGVVSQLGLYDAVYKLIEADITPVILEDALLGSDVDPIHYLDYIYQLGAVPSAQKSHGYEMYVEIQLGDFTEEEIAAYYQMIALNEVVIPEVYPRLR
ncbi:isochorismatase family protein [Pseudoalteromonas sp. MMG005]|uniref:isochorismatase family protein n=1 Tax=Pseudoalteromonas sp. MMG005 TaxID=2822682 RepID=UPI001B3A1E57|nr:isochorismatase family protein [Pseudoalteromonas sp. MMG005]MBQ4848435.1 isochorismatase family protein [Pseudoalteromonas sp. MMG005]